MPTSIAASLSIASGLLTGVLTIATVVVANRFFERLKSQQPELSDAFHRPSALTQYGPIYPSKQAYLKERRFEQLTDVELRGMGQASLMLLKAQAVALVLFVICLLWWATAKQLA